MFPKKIIPAFLVLFYFTAIIAGNFCATNGVSGHPHQKTFQNKIHQVQKARESGHSLWCLVACPGSVTLAGSTPPLIPPLFFSGVSLFIIFLQLQSYQHTLHNKAPPLTF
jgi:hypothetical protein